MESPYLIILALLGWGLSLYFGFFRYRQFQWTRKKVQYDLFTRINQRSDQLFLRVTALATLQQKNAKLKAKFRGVLHKYLEGWQEKIMMIQADTVNEKMARFWVDGMLNELTLLGEQQQELIHQLNETVNEEAISMAVIRAHLNLAANPTEGKEIKTQLLLELSQQTPNPSSI